MHRSLAFPVSAQIALKPCHLKNSEISQDSACVALGLCSFTIFSDLEVFLAWYLFSTLESFFNLISVRCDASSDRCVCSVECSRVQTLKLAFAFKYQLKLCLFVCGFLLQANLLSSQTILCLCRTFCVFIDHSVSSQTILCLHGPFRVFIDRVFIDHSVSSYTFPCLHRPFRVFIDHSVSLQTIPCLHRPFRVFTDTPLDFNQIRPGATQIIN